MGMLLLLSLLPTRHQLGCWPLCKSSPSPSSSLPLSPHRLSLRDPSFFGLLPPPPPPPQGGRGASARGRRQEARGKRQFCRTLGGTSKRALSSRLYWSAK